MVEQAAQANLKLAKLRELMSSHEVDAYLVFHNDAHQSEYLAVCDERIKFISGFSGSNGICVITQSEALCWTDSRYYLQAEKQLQSGWKMMKWEGGSKTYFEWIAETLTTSGQKIGYDATQIGASAYRNRSKYFTEKGIIMKAIDKNLVDEVWDANKPPIPQEKVFIHEVKYSGETVQ
jgi:Xaa-Pro aminopeptidase